MANTTAAQLAALTAQVAELQAALAARPVRKAAAPKAEVPCRCADFVTDAGEHTGCKSTTKATFAPGHDAKTKGLLAKAAAAGIVVHDAKGETNDKGRDPMDIAAEFGFASLVAAARDKIVAKATEKKNRADRKAADAVFAEALAATVTKK
jgi:hypothetical protein